MVRGRTYHLRVLTPDGMRSITGRFVEKSASALHFLDPYDLNTEYRVPECCLFGVRTALWPN